MNKENFLASGLLEQYALGITSPEENILVERYLEQFPQVREEYTAMRKALDQYAQQYAKQPPQVLRQRVLDSVDEESDRISDANEPIPGRSAGDLRQAGWSKYISYAVVVALAVGLFLVTKKADTLEQDLNEAEVLLSACKSDVEHLRSTQSIYAFLISGHTRQVAIKGTPLSPETRLIAYWNDESGKALLNPVHLPEPPAGKQYQIWADVEGKMISLGLIAKEPSKDQLADLSFIPHAESLNITLEPEGGSEEPTVSMLMANGYIL